MAVSFNNQALLIDFTLWLFRDKKILKLGTPEDIPAFVEEYVEHLKWDDSEKLLLNLIKMVWEKHKLNQKNNRDDYLTLVIPKGLKENKHDDYLDNMQDSIANVQELLGTEVKLIFDYDEN